MIDQFTLQQRVIRANVLSNNANMQRFQGNPGDYEWGREGLDAIVTQSLNQMNTYGSKILKCK